MDRLDRLRLFVAVADKASFAEAARSLGVSPTAASRAVSSLEAELGVALLRRTTRSVSLTPEGVVYLNAHGGRSTTSTRPRDCFAASGPSPEGC